MKPELTITLLMISFLLSGCAQNPIPGPCSTPGCDQQANGKDIENGTKIIALDEHQNSQMITFGEGFSGYLVEPSTPGMYPGVVMIHEWWGLNDNIKQQAHDLAKEGYVVLAVDLYNGKVATTPDEARQYATAVRNNPQGALLQMKEAVSYLKSLESINSIASMGWCFGGQMSMQLALIEQLDATVIYYGNLETNESRLQNIDWPVLGIFGETDTGIPPATVRQFESALNNLNIENEIYIYDGVGHAFANPSNPGHDPAKTKDAWDKTVLFLNRHLKNSAQQ